MIVAAYTLRHSAFNDPTLSDDLAAIWAYVANPLVFALVSVAVGSLLHSNGAAIGVSLGFVARRRDPHRPGRQLRQRGVRVLPPARRHRHRGATRPPRRTSRWPRRSRQSSLWLAAFLGAGLSRVLRDEY